MFTNILAGLQVQMNEALASGDMVKFNSIVDAMKKLSENTLVQEQVIEPVQEEKKEETAMFKRTTTLVEDAFEVLTSVEAGSVIDCVDQEIVNTIDYVKRVVGKTTNSTIAKKALKVAKGAVVTKLAVSGIEAVGDLTGISVNLDTVDEIADTVLTGAVLAAGSVVAYNAFTTKKENVDWDLF